MNTVVKWTTVMDTTMNGHSCKMNTVVMNTTMNTRCDEHTQL